MHILKQGEFSLFLGGNEVLDPIGKTLVIVVAQNTICYKTSVWTDFG